jgi:putative transposase
MKSSVPVKLKKGELSYLESYKNSSTLSLREYNRVNILLLLHKGKRIMDIEEFLQVDRITIWRTKKKYLEQGIKKALEEDARSGQPIKYATDQQAELSVMACGPCPAGRRRWTIRLLAEALQKKQGFETINRETIRLALKKMNVSLG